MEENSVINLLLLTGAISILINMASISVFAGSAPDAITNFMIPLACMQENSTYMIAAPTSTKLCKNIRDYAKNFDGAAFKETCEILEGADKDSCIAVAKMYETRISDCTALMYTFDLESALNPKASSVTNAQARQACGRFG